MTNLILTISAEGAEGTEESKTNLGREYKNESQTENMNEWDHKYRPAE